MSGSHNSSINTLIYVGLLTAHHQAGTTHLSYSKNQGQHNIRRSILSQPLQLLVFLLIFLIMQSKCVRLCQACYFKKDQFTTVKYLYYVKIIKYNLAPTFQPCSQQICQHYILHYYAIEKLKLVFAIFIFFMILFAELIDSSLPLKVGSYLVLDLAQNLSFHYDLRGISIVHIVLILVACSI